MIQKKICMVGAFGVGKTSLVARFVHSIFSEKYQTTVGVKIDKKVVQVDGREVTLVLWDIAGQDALTTVRASHVRGASGYILVIDGLRRETMDVALDLQRRVSETVGSVPFICVLNKADSRDAWQVQQADLDQLSAKGWLLQHTSAKTGTGVEELFHDLAGAMVKTGEAPDEPASAVAG